MSAALERVIADQQKEIDRMRLAISQNNDYLQRNYKARESLASACFGVLNNRGSMMHLTALRDELREQGWCIRCECLPCECDDD